MTEKSSTAGRVLGIALRNGPLVMREVPTAQATAGAGLTGDHQVSAERGITFISAPQWAEVTRELNAELPWFTRRANVLLDWPALGELIGRTIRVGPVRVAIKGETRPCGLMDRLYNGLRAALKPEFRAGVHGEVLNAGQIQVGDEVRVED